MKLEVSSLRAGEKYSLVRSSGIGWVWTRARNSAVAGAEEKYSEAR